VVRLIASSSWTDDVVWHVPGSSPIAGDHRGHHGVVEYFRTRRRIAENSMRFHPGEMLTEEDLVVQRVDGTAVLGGESVDWRTVGFTGSKGVASPRCGWFRSNSRSSIGCGGRVRS
jgi:hypothetical protein